VIRRLTSILAIAGIASIGPIAPAAADEPGPDPNRARLQEQLREVRQEIDAIRERLDEALGERDRALDTLAQSERAVSRAERARRQTNERLRSTEKRREALAAEQDQLEQAVIRNGEALGRQLLLAYRQGRQSRVKVLLDQDDPRRISRHLAYHGYLSRARLGAIDRLNRTRSQLESTGAALAAEENQLRRLADQQAAEVERLEQARSEREVALAAVERRIQTRQEELARLEQDAAELAQLLDRLATALADIPPEVDVPSIVELRGELPMPINGRLRHGFGESRGGEVLWNGWMLAAEQGNDVRAIAHGRVAYADWLRGYGLILIIDHGDAFMSLYAHNEALLRDVGDWVRPGEVIASVGNTGRGGEPGLYFELRRNGEPLNPAGWLVER
jgi:septal ring factor EnvC (AmiA/AmiB activator)